MPEIEQKLLRRRDVEQRLGVSRSFIFSALARGEFPKPIKLGPQAMRWRIEDIDNWVAEREAATA